MATYRGQDGVVGVAGVSVGELRSWTLEGLEIEPIETTKKGDSFKGYRAGLGEGGSVTLECWFDYTATAQATLIDDVLGASGTQLSLLLVVSGTLATSTNKRFVITNAFASGIPEISSPEGSSLAVARLTCKVSGQITIV